MSIKAVIFDLGNVLINIHFERCFQVWAERTNFDAAKIATWFSEDEMYCRHERGEISSEDYAQYISKSLDINLSHDDFLKGWNSIFGTTISETLQFAKQQGDRLQFFILTNSNESHRAIWSKQFQDELSFAEKIYCSSQIHARKPESNAYQHVLNDCGLNPDQVLFVDDKIENIKGAEQIGIRSILFDNPRSALLSLGNAIET